MNEISRYHLPCTLHTGRQSSCPRARGALSARTSLSSNMSLCGVPIRIMLYSLGHVWFYREQLFLGARGRTKLRRRVRDPTSFSAKMPSWFNLYLNEWKIAVFVGEIGHGIFPHSFSLLPVIILYAFLVSALIIGHCQNDDVDETGRRFSN